MEISEKLLSEVLELDVTNYKYPSFGTYIDYSKLYVIYKKENIEYSLLVNIYELAHKCKVWAWDKGYGFESLPFAEKIFNRFNSSDLMSFGYSNEDRKDRIPYKIKYLFKACQWILDNKED